MTQMLLSPSISRQAAESNRSSRSSGPDVLSRLHQRRDGDQHRLGRTACQAGAPCCLRRRVFEGGELPILATVVICQPVERHAIRARGA